MLGTLKRAGDVLDVFPVQVLTIGGRLRIRQIAVQRCVARVTRLWLRPHAASVPLFTRDKD